MKKIVEKTKFARLLLVFFMLIFATIETSSGANRYLVASGDWETLSIWSDVSGGPGGYSYPTGSDVVYIERGNTVTVSKDAYCNKLYIGQVGIAPGNIVVNGGVKLSYTQEIGMTVVYTPQDGAVSSTCYISGGGNFFITNFTIGSSAITPSGVQTTTLVSTIGNMVIQGNLYLVADCEGSASNQNSPVFLLNEGSVTIAGNIVPTTTSIGGDVSFKMDQGNHTGTLKLGSATPWQTDANFQTPWGSGFVSYYNVQLYATGTTVEYYGATQNVRQLSYYNLTLSGSGAKTLGATTSVERTLSLQGTATCVNSPAYGATSTLEYKGTSAQLTTANEFVSGANGPLNLIIDNTAGVSLHAPRTLRTTGSNTLTLKSGILSLTATNNITLSDNSTIVRTGGSMTLSPVFGSNVNVFYPTYTASFTTGFELPTTNGVLNNLTIDNAKGVTLNANVNVKGAIVINGMLICGTKIMSGDGTFALNDAAVLKTGIATGINGSISVSGTKTFNAGASYSFNGTVAQVTGSLMPLTIRNLTIENTHASGVTLTNNVAVSGLASVTKILNCADKIISGSGAFTLASGATILTANIEGISLDGTSGSIQVSGAILFHYNSNFTYNGTAAQYTGTGIVNINKLTINNAAGVTLSTSVSDPAIVGSLIINSGKVFIIDVNTAMTVTGTTSLGSAECLVIKSTPSGTGSFIDNGFAQTGTAKIERWVSNNGSQRWEYVSSPILDASSQVFTSSIHGLRYADEPTNSWVRISNDFPETMTLLKGYTRSYQATNDGENSAALFIGAPNTGEISLAVTYSPNAAGVGHGWNLMGNPYPSSIDWYAAEGWTKDNIKDAIYFRKNGTVCSYIDGTGTMGASNIIPPMQAFWIRADNESNGTLTIDNRVRVHQDIQHYKGPKTVKNTLHLTITTADNLKKDDAYVCFRDGATNNFDANYDAYKFFGDDATWPQIYSVAGMDKLSINKLEPISGEQIVKLGLKNLVPGKYTITADMVSSLTSNGYSVSIENIQTGTSQDLSANNKYTFTVGAKANVDYLILRFNGGLLPIQLIDFEPICLNNEVQINWSTATEINNNYFTIERSKDAVEWEFVNKTQGSGNSNVVQKYSVFDTYKPDGLVYYRLTQTDFDGKSKIFNSVSLNCNERTENITFYPNPFSSTINVELNGAELKNGMITIYNTLGVVVYSKSISSNDLNSFEIDLQDLPKGIYTIEFKSDSFSKIEKIIKK